MLPWKMLAVLAAAALIAGCENMTSGLERRRDWSSARQWYRHGSRRKLWPSRGCGSDWRRGRVHYRFRCWQ
jgi:hypothetical protein